MPEHTEPMVRAQLLLTPSLRQRLARLARQEGRSLSDVARRALHAGLDTLEGRTDEGLRQNLQTLEALTRQREEMEARHGVYDGDLVAESRRDREEREERVWRGE